jgi:uncharacterized LabA/DUF88 family protein
MKKVAFIIDGAFMSRRVNALRAFEYSGKNIKNYCKRFVRKLFPQGEGEIFRVFYYDGKPSLDSGYTRITKRPYTLQNSRVAHLQNKLHEELRTTSLVALRLGEAKWDNHQWDLKAGALDDLLKKLKAIDDLQDDDFIPRVKQKGIDIKMGLDIASLVHKRQIDVLVVIAGDNDFVPAVKLARNEGMIVVLDPLWNHVSQELQENVDILKTALPKVIDQPLFLKRAGAEAASSSPLRI